MAEFPKPWTRFESWDHSFSIEYPAQWRVLDPPLSEGASLSCGVPHTLLEGFGFEWGGPPEPGGPDLVTILGDGIVETAGKEAGQSNGRVISRRKVRFKKAGHSQRVLVTYTERGLKTTTDYCIVGTGNKAVQIAFKVLSTEYDRMLPVFEEILNTLGAPWMLEQRSADPPPRPAEPKIAAGPYSDASGLADKVVSAIARQCNVERGRISPTTHFIKDLKMDSLDAMELIMDVEEDLDLEIPDEEAQKIETVADAIGLCGRLTGRTEA